MTADPFHDRLGAPDAHPGDDTLLLGRWLLRDDGEGGTGSPYRVVAPPSGGGTWFEETASGRVRGHASAEHDLLLDEQDPSKVSLVARAIAEVASLYRGDLTWADVLRRPPLDPSVSAHVSLDDLERDLVDPEGPLDHLAQVCVEPRESLGQRTERVPVHRARRVPPQALRYLASHSEDWASATPTRVRPSHVLTVLPEDSFDIYENRVAYQLHRRLEQRVRQRIDLLGADAELLGGTRSIPEGATRHLLERLGHLHEKAKFDWAASGDVDVEDLSHLAEESRAALVALSDRLGRLRLTLLLATPRARGGVDSKAHVPADLAATNLFVQHEHYRPVGALWKRARVQGAAMTEQQVAQAQGDLVRDYDEVCSATAAHALNNLGFEPTGSPEALRGGEGVQFSGDRGTVWVSRCADGTLRLEAQGTEPLRLVPLAVRITPTALPQLQATLPVRTVILVPAAPPGATGPFDVIGSGPTAGHVVVVSPRDLLSTERLAQAFQAWFSASQFEAYPFPIPRGLGAAWVSRTPRGDLGVRPPSAGEVDAWVADARRRAAGRGQTAPPPDEMEEFERACHCLRALAVCPVCGVTGGEFKPRLPRAFWAKCSNRCQSEWGLLEDGHGGRVPVIRPSGLHLDPSVDSKGILSRLGRDLVAVPWVDEYGEAKYGSRGGVG